MVRISGTIARALVEQRKPQATGYLADHISHPEVAEYIAELLREGRLVLTARPGRPRNDNWIVIARFVENLLEETPGLKLDAAIKAAEEQFKVAQSTVTAARKAWKESEKASQDLQTDI